MKTAVVEKDQVGGRCLKYACIPAKAGLRAADVLQAVRVAGESGISGAEPAVDFAEVQERRLKVIQTLTVQVGDDLLRVGKGVILATGSVKRPIPGTQFGGRVIGTEEPWALEALPRSLVVVGAGASGTEIASAYARLGMTSSRASTVCCPPRTPRSRSSPSAASSFEPWTAHPRASKNVSDVQLPQIKEDRQ